MKFYNLFENISGIVASFDIPDDVYIPTEDEIIVAWYSYEDYDGQAYVLYQHDGKLYEVHGGHCSCHGLEEQWEPEETSWALLRARPTYPWIPAVMNRIHQEMYRETRVFIHRYYDEDFTFDW